MQLGEFVAALEALTLTDIRALALDLDGMVATPAEEIEVTVAYLSIEANLRRIHRLREAAHAGHRASSAVVAAAAREHADLPDAAVTHVARAAATIARGLVAGEAVNREVCFLATGFRHARPVARLALA